MMVMMAGERDRDRGPRGDTGAATSLWIDYLLLPEKLEEHLAAIAAGNSYSPSPAELITVFLDQALLSQKASLGYSLGVINKDGVPAPDASTVVSKTAALLCERAARVAVSANLSLEEIEASISSAQHQFMLLKALVKHDKSRLLIHECDLNRWILRNALQSHPLGSAAPNATLSGSRAVVWTLAEDLIDREEASDSGCWSVSVSRNVSDGVARSPLEEESLAIDFLENVLSHKDGICPKGTSSGCKLSSSIAQEREDQSGVNKSRGIEAIPNSFPSKEYWCQIMLDVAEVHFMRGRIHIAHELFTKCAELAKSHQRDSERDKSPGEGALQHVGRQNNVEAPCSASSIPMQRLAGFIVACRMLLGLYAKSNVTEGRDKDLNEIAVNTSSLLFLGEPSAAQRIVIACERSRYSAKQSAKSAQSIVSETKHDDDLPSEPPTKKLRSFHSGDKGGTTSLEFQEGNIPQDGTEDAVSGAAGSQASEDLATKSISGEPEGKEKAFRVECMELGGNNASALGAVGGTASVEVSTPDDIARFTSFPQAKGFITSLNENALKDTGFGEAGDWISEAGGRDGRRLVEIVVGDTLQGHLKKGYRISLARDPDIPMSIHCQLVACNVVRDIVNTAPMQLFLQVSDSFRDNAEGLDFLMSLMAAVKKSCSGMAGADTFNTSLELQGYGRVQIRAGFEKTSPDVGSIASDKDLSSSIGDFALYVCCVLDSIWCWRAALRHNLIISTAVPKILVSEQHIIQSELTTLKSLDDTAHSSMVSGVKDDSNRPCGDSEQLKRAHSQSRLSKDSELVNMEVSFECPYLVDVRKLEVLFCALLTAEAVRDIEELVSEVDRLLEARKIKDGSRSSETDSVTEHVNVGTDSTGRWVTIAMDAAAILRRRAFNALDSTTEHSAAVKLFELARTIYSDDHDSMMMLWLLEKMSLKEGASVRLPVLEEVDKEVILDLGAIEYVLICLVEKELWNDLSEFCEWGLSVIKKERSTASGISAEGARRGQGTGFDIWYKRCAQVLKVATTLAELMQLCSALLSATGLNHYNEDVARISLRISQLFEDFLCLLVGIDVEGSSSTEDGNQSWGSQNYKGYIMPLNFRAVPLISQLSNSRVLMSLASLMAGWLQRCNIAGLRPWPLSIERYGGLAAVTSGASLPPPLGSLSHGAGVFCPFPPRIPPEFGKECFRVLLERIVELPGVVEKDKEKGHRWLQGLADLAFEDELYVKALQLYLQAGGIRSAYYCDRSSAMPRDVFTPWVLRRMVQGCRAIGATVQAALLCQSLPGPDHESAFRILQENSLIVVRDAVAYFDCVWEVPLLELLVHMHSKSGDQERHSALISLLQQPALNAHNPQSVRVAHVASLEQRFLQRLCGELF